MTAIGSRTGLSFRTSFVEGQFWDHMSDEEKESLFMGFCSKVSGDAWDGSAPQAPPDREMRADSPALFEYLTSTVFEDGSVRQTSTLLIFVDGTEFKACLNDRENERSLWASGDTLEGCLGTLEALLCDSKAPWRRNKDKAPKPAPGGRKK